MSPYKLKVYWLVSTHIVWETICDVGRSLGCENLVLKIPWVSSLKYLRNVVSRVHPPHENLVRTWDFEFWVGPEYPSPQPENGGNRYVETNHCFPHRYHLIITVKLLTFMNPGSVMGLPLITIKCVGFFTLNNKINCPGKCYFVMEISGNFKPTQMWQPWKWPQKST